MGGSEGLSIDFQWLISRGNGECHSGALQGPDVLPDGSQGEALLGAFEFQLLSCISEENGSLRTIIQDGICFHDMSCSQQQHLSHLQKDLITPSTSIHV